MGSLSEAISKIRKDRQGILDTEKDRQRREQLLTGLLPKQHNLTLGQEFVHGIARIPHSVAGHATSLAGTLFKSPDLLETSKRTREQSRELFPSEATGVDSVDDFTSLSASEWLRLIVSEAPESAATTLIPMAAGATLGRPLAKLAGYAAGKIGMPIAAATAEGIGMGAATFAGSTGLELGSIGQEFYDKHDKPADVMKILPAAMVAGAAESVTPFHLLSAIKGNSGIVGNPIRRAVMGFLREAPQEAGTEYVQTLVEEIGLLQAEGVPADEAITRTLNNPDAHARGGAAGILGGFSGGGMGGISNMAFGNRPAADVAEQMNTPTIPTPKPAPVPGVVAPAEPKLTPTVPPEAGLLDRLEETKKLLHQGNWNQIPQPVNTVPSSLSATAPWDRTVPMQDSQAAMSEAVLRAQQMPVPPVQPVHAPMPAPAPMPQPAPMQAPQPMPIPDQEALKARLREILDQRPPQPPIQSEPVQTAPVQDQEQRGPIPKDRALALPQDIKLADLFLKISQIKAENDMKKSQPIPLGENPPAGQVIQETKPQSPETKTFADDKYDEVHKSLSTGRPDGGALDVALRWTKTLLGDMPAMKHSVAQIVDAMSDKRNKLSRQFFTKLTGLKLPPTIKGSREVLMNAKALMAENETLKNTKTEYFNGDAISLTGKTLEQDGQQLEEFTYVTGRKKGQTGVRPTAAQRQKNTDEKLKAFNDQQAEFRKLNEPTWTAPNKFGYSFSIAPSKDGGFVVREKDVKSNTITTQGRPGPRPWSRAEAEQYVRERDDEAKKAVEPAPASAIVDKVQSAKDDIDVLTRKFQAIKRRGGKPTQEDLALYDKLKTFIDEAAANQPAKPTTTPDIDAELDSAWAEFNEIAKRITSGLDPQLAAAGLKVAGLYIKKGILQFRDFAKFMKEKTGANWDKTKRYALSFWTAAIGDYPDSGAEELTNSQARAIIEELEGATTDEKPESPDSKPTGENRQDDGTTRDTRTKEEPVLQGPVPVVGGDVSTGVAPDETQRDTSEASSGRRDPGRKRDVETPGERGDDRKRKRDRNAGDGKPADQRPGRIPVVQEGTEGTPGLDRDGNLGGVVENAPKPKEIIPEDRNHVIEEGDILHGSGMVDRANANIAAIKLVKKLQAEGRNATPAEKKIIAKFSGWGALKDLFNPTYSAILIKAGDKAKTLGPVEFNQIQRYGNYAEFTKWRDRWGTLLHPSLGGIFTLEEFNDASDSTSNAHYTEIGVARAMWDIAGQLGFKGGVVLEPSAGSGIFLGSAPGTLAEKSKFAAVELDSMTGAILEKLYPQADVKVMGFQDSGVKNNSVDLVIGNVPFSGSEKINGKLVHNYFMEKSLDTLRPGGLMVLITSAGTMDAITSREVRERLGQRGDFVGAIRLPGTAFTGSAGTKVVTDIIIFRKKMPGAPDVAVKPFELSKQFDTYQDGKDEKSVNVNEYFLDNKEMIVGDMTTGRGLYAPKEMIVNFSGDVAAAVRDRMAMLPRDISGPDVGVVAGSIFRAPAKQGTVVGSIIVNAAGDIVFAGSEAPVEIPEKLGRKAVKKEDILADLKTYVKLRDTYSELLYLQRTEETDTKVDAVRKKLNTEYDALVSRVGFLSELHSAHPISECVRFPVLLSLEKPAYLKKVDGKAVRVSPAKEDIFTRRTDKPFSPPTSASSPYEGAMISVSVLGRIDVAYIAKLTGMTPDSVGESLAESGTAFKDPSSGQYVESSEYLSGRVVEKLRLAKEAGAEYASNVAALEKVQPKLKEKGDIDANPGVTWIDEEAYNSFGVSIGLRRGQIELLTTGEFRVNQGAAAETYGGAKGPRILQNLLNGKDQTVKGKDADGKTYTDEEATREADAIAKAMTVAFSEWFQSSDVTDDAVRVFNERISGIVPRDTYVPDFLVTALEAAARKRSGQKLLDGDEKLLEMVRFPGQTADITLDPHQIKAVWRSIRQNTMLAHFPGAGKTFTFIAAAMQMKRLGLARRPMIVVHNSTVSQYAASVSKLFPGANVLVPTKSDRERANRRRLLGKVTATDWDIVIVPTSYFQTITGSMDRAMKKITRKVEELRADLALEGDEKSKNAKKISAKIRNYKARLVKRMKELSSKADPVIAEDLGIDAVLIDEAHDFKKSDFETKKENVRGLPSGTSDRAGNLELVLDYVRERAKGESRNIVMATGTPISNTMAEAYVFMRFLRPDLLAEMGLEEFDDFANTFFKQTNDFEITDSGEYKPIARFSDYSNLQSFNNLIRETFDVVGENDVKRARMVKMKTGKPILVEVPKNDPQNAFFEHLRYRAYQYYNQFSKKEKKERSSDIVEIQNLLRKASIDLRLVDSSAPAPKESKINVAANNIISRYKASTPMLGTQFVFCDLFNSPDKKFNVFHEVKKLLVAGGIPASEVAEIPSGATEEKRQELFQAVREGKIRILMGTSAKVGVGVDVAERMVAAHHLDVPQRPDMWEQRNKRVIRQTNINDEAEIFFYGTEKSMDSRAFNLLTIKQGFIDKALRGEATQGEDFDEDSSRMSFAELSAVLSGDTRLLTLMAKQREYEQVLYRNITLTKARNTNEYGIKNAKSNIIKDDFEISRTNKMLEATKDFLNINSYEDIVEKADLISIGYRNVPKDAEPAIVVKELKEWRDLAMSNESPPPIRIKFPGNVEVKVTSRSGDTPGTVSYYVESMGGSEFGLANSGIDTAIRKIVTRLKDNLEHSEDWKRIHEKAIARAEKELESLQKPDTDKQAALKEEVSKLETELSDQKKTMDPVDQPAWIDRYLLSSDDPVKVQRRKDKAAARKNEDRDIDAEYDNIMAKNPRGGRTDLPALVAEYAEKGLKALAELAVRFYQSAASFAQFVSAAVAQGFSRSGLGGLWSRVREAAKHRAPTGRTGGIGKRGITPRVAKGWRGEGISKKDAAVMAEKPDVKTRIEKPTTPQARQGVAFYEGVKTERAIARQAVAFKEMTAAEAVKEVIRTGKMSDRVRAVLVKESRVLPVAERGKFLADVVKAKTEDDKVVLTEQIGIAKDESDRNKAYSNLKSVLRRLKLNKLRPEFAAAARKLLKKLPEPGISPYAVARGIRRFLKSDEIVLPDYLLEGIDKIMRRKDRRSEAAQIKTITAALRAIAKQNANRNKLIFGETVADAMEKGAAISEFVGKQPAIPREPGKDPKAGFLRWFFNEGALNLEQVSEMLGDVGRKIFYSDLNDGYREGLSLWHKGRDVLKSAMQKNGLDPDTDETAKWAQKEVSIPTAGGMVKIERQQKLSLAAHIMDTSTRAELLKGGILLGEQKETGSRIKLTDDDLSSILATLDEKETAVVSAIRGYLNNDLKKAVNRAALALYGFEKAVSGDYFPRKRKLEQTGMTPEQKRWGKGSLEGMGIFKERSTSSAPVIIDSIFHVYNQHIKAAGMFAGMSVPVRNIKVILESGGVRKSATAQYGKQFITRIEDHLEALQDMGSPGGGEVNRGLAKFLRNIQASFLGFNPRSMLKQFGGLFTASAEMSAEDLGKGMAGMGSKRIRELITKYSPKLRERYDSAGAGIFNPSFDLDDGVLVAAKSKLNKFHDTAMSGLTAFDRAISEAIWGAAEAEIKRSHPNLVGDSFYEKVALRAEEVVSRTQNVTSVIDMSGVALESRKNAFLKVATAFQSQGNAMYNMIRRAVGLHKQGKITDGELAARIAAVTLGNAMFVALVGSIMKAGGGDDKDKKKVSELSEALYAVAQENLGMIYGASLVAPSLVNGVKAAMNDRSTYGRPVKIENVAESVGRTTMEGVVETVKAFAQAGDKFKSGRNKGKDKGSVAAGRGADKLLRGVAAAAGLPQFAFTAAKLVGYNP